MKKGMAFFLAAMLAFMMAACGGAPSSGASSGVAASSTPPESESAESGAAAVGADTPENAVKLAFDAFKKQDLQTFAQYTGDAGAMSQAEQTTGGDKDLEKVLVQDFHYEIQGVQQDGDSAVVTVSITNVDLSNLFRDVIAWSVQLSKDQPNISEEEANKRTAEKTEELLKAAAGKTATAVCEITATKGADGWKITLDPKATDALYGGMISGMSDALNSVMSQLGGS